jgi:hypothetical protein
MIGECCGRNGSWGSHALSQYMHGAGYENRKDLFCMELSAEPRRKHGMECVTVICHYKYRPGLSWSLGSIWLYMNKRLVGKRQRTSLVRKESQFSVLFWMKGDSYKRSAVFTMVTMRNAIFWDVTPPGSYKDWCFGGMYHFHHQGGMVVGRQ